MDVVLVCGLVFVVECDEVCVVVAAAMTAAGRIR